MSKVKNKQQKTGGGSEIRVKTSEGKVKARKKKKYLFQHPEIKGKEVKKDLCQPPKRAEDFSLNWKTLLGMLNSEQNSNPKKLQSAPDKVAPSRERNEPESSLKKPKASGGKVNENNHEADKTKKKSKVRERVEGASRKAKEEEEKKLTEADIWFDDVDPDDLEATVGSEAADILRKRTGVLKTDVESAEKRTEQLLVKETTCDGLTRAVAIDCEMVGVGPGGEDSMLARVSVVNYFGKCVYDKFVKPTEKVTDYRTAVSGIRPEDIKNGEKFRTVQKEVARIIQGRILVGHAIQNDLKILLLDHPKKLIRDTQKYKPFRKIAQSGRPALRVLCQRVLNVKVQQGEHSSVQDAQATMRLYTLVKKKWEVEIKASRGQKNKSQKNETKAKPDSKTAPQSTHNNNGTTD